MGRINRAKLRRIVERTPLLTVQRSHGERGTESFRDLAVAITAIFDHVDPEEFSGMIIVFKCLDDSNRPIPETTARGITNPASLSQEVEGNVILQILADGRIIALEGRGH
jgi:hypothetical protein